MFPGHMTYIMLCLYLIEALGPKNWDMRGEVRGQERPENSLLEAIVETERYVYASVRELIYKYVYLERQNLLPSLHKHTPRPLKI